MDALILLMLILGQIRDSTVQVQYYGYSYRTDEWWVSEEIYFYVYLKDDDPLSYPIMVGYDEDWVKEWGRGYAQFDLSFIPPGATIQSAGIRFYVAYDGQWEDEWDGSWSYLLLRSMEQNLADWYPNSGGESSTLFNDAYDGYLFVDDSFYVQMDPQYNVYYPSDSTFLPLNQTFIDYLNSRLAQGITWIGVGIMKDDEEGSDAGVNFFGEKTYLYVSYLMPNQLVLYDPTVAPDTGEVGSLFSFLIHYYDNYSYAPYYIDAVVLKPDGVEDTFSLSLLQGQAYDGVYGVRVPLNDEGQYYVYFYAINSQDVYCRIPENGFLTGPFVMRDTIYLYNPFVSADTGTNSTPFTFHIDYYSRFTSCDSVKLFYFLYEPFDSTKQDTFEVLMDLVSGSGLQGTYEKTGSLGIGHYKHFYVAYNYKGEFRYPEVDALDGPVVLQSGIGEAVAQIGYFEVFDVVGRLVGRVKSPSDLKSLKLPSGVYFLRQKDVKSKVKKVIYWR
ncbi:MAG: hypothetical protein QMD82_00985 [bacterium]|nr:hypothetical protein [bacterium]